MSRLAMLVFVLLLGLAPFVTADPSLARPAARGKARLLETGLLPAAADEARRDGPRVSVKDRYIVQLNDNAGDPLGVAKTLASDDLVPTHVFRHVFKGFAARVGPKQLAALRKNPNVVAVEPDRIAHATAGVVSGVNRIDADLNSVADIDGDDDVRVDVDVAVIDSGIILHSDLNVWAWANCSSSEPGQPIDGNGHGTHVAGTVGALDNGSGVVGVAPGARIWGIKVLDSSGFGSFADIICGMDVVALHSRDQGDLGDIEVANMSLTANTTDNSACGGSSAFHNAACRVVAAGVTLVAAAGNAASNANGYVPATYDEVITVSALADSDGQPGGNGGNTSAGADDTFATFSNFGADVDLAAPGVDITSTWKDGGYRILNGTSMASPHVAGAAALYIAEHGDVGPAAVKSGLLANRERFDIPNDPDSTAEGIVNVDNFGGPPPDTTPPTVTITAPKAGAVVKKGVLIKLAANDIGSGVKKVQVRYCPGRNCGFASGRPIGGDDTAPYAVKWTRQPRNGVYTLIAQVTDHTGHVGFSREVTVTVKN